MDSHEFDVVILGGGVAGSATALSVLRDGTQSVCVVERSDFSTPRIGETIPPDTSVLLHELGLWAAFADQAHLPCFGSHSTWGSENLGHNDFLTSPYGHGWHLDRSAFDAMLLAQAERRGATVLRVACDGIDVSDDEVTAVRTTQGRVTGRRFVDATGRAGVLTRQLGATRQYDDRQTVVWARFAEPNLRLGHTTWLEAVPYGWWYAAELPGHQQIIALGTEPHIAKSAGLYNKRIWLDHLREARHISTRMAAARLVDRSFQITASDSFLVTPLVGPNWIAVGDAASGFDPITSAGIHKALSTGRQAGLTLCADCWRQSSSAYSRFVNTEYRAYLRGKSELYAAETRWVEAPFWAHRRRRI